MKPVFVDLIRNIHERRKVSLRLAAQAIFFLKRKSLGDTVKKFKTVTYTIRLVN